MATARTHRWVSWSCRAVVAAMTATAAVAGGCADIAVPVGLGCSESGGCPVGQQCVVGENVCRVPTQAAAIAAGGRHTCAVVPDTATARCWGAADAGQLGYGNSSAIGDDEAPALAGDIDLGGPVQDLVAGDRHTCALMTGGGVRCWGDAGFGVLGYGPTDTNGDSTGDVNGDSIGDDEAPATAGDVALGGVAAQIATGQTASCAVLDGGALRCWGYGFDGQLGYGNRDVVGDDETPADAGNVDLGGPATQVAVGAYHTCALLDTGDVRCFGYPLNGRLGYPVADPIGDDETPADVAPVDVGGRAVQLAAGYAHTCALLDTGRVRCWGRGTEGRLGYGAEDDIGDDEPPSARGDIDLGGAAVQVAAGDRHTCALLDTGTVRCWGRGADGQLGYGNTRSIGDDESPASAGDVDVGGLVRAIAAGRDHTCALLDTGRVRCWGRGADGRLGYGRLENVGDNEPPAAAGDVPVAFQ